MDGKRIRDYWSKEVEALLDTYRQFERLIPHKTQNASAHKGEDGRYVEELIKEYLKKFLPNSLEVLTGFILRPAVKTDKKGYERSGDEDEHSTQLDMLICDTQNYPVFQRFGDSVIVPPECVIGIISVKKHLNNGDISKECVALCNASKLCSVNMKNNEVMRGPFTGLISVKSNIKIDKSKTPAWVFEKMENTYLELTKRYPVYFDNLLNYVGAFQDWSVTKKRPIPKDNGEIEAEYIYFEHSKEEGHLGLQLLLTGILSVFYDNTRSQLRRPGFTAFEDGRFSDKKLGTIKTEKMR
jgi:hypothetical protein